MRFYEHFDFAPSPNDDRTLMILMKDVRAKALAVLLAVQEGLLDLDLHMARLSTSEARFRHGEAFCYAPPDLVKAAGR